MFLPPYIFTLLCVRDKFIYTFSGSTVSVWQTFNLPKKNMHNIFKLFELMLMICVTHLKKMSKVISGYAIGTYLSPSQYGILHSKRFDFMVKTLNPVNAFNNIASAKLAISKTLHLLPFSTHFHSTCKYIRQVQILFLEFCNLPFTPVAWVILLWYGTLIT